MKNIFLKLSVAALMIVSISCKDTFEDDITRDNIPDTPIVFTGAYSVGFNPYYTVAYSGGTGAITITMTIPDSSPRTFKSIDRFIAGATSLTTGSIITSTGAVATTPGNYRAVPIAASGKTVTISTSVTEFNAQPTTVIPAAAKIPTSATGASPASPPSFNVPYHERAFMFLVRLDDDSTIIPEQVRIRVTY